MQRIAALPMYPIEEAEEATDAFWRALAGRLAAAGVEHVPATLSRGLAHRAGWADPLLLFGQSCGWPLVTRFAGRLAVVARPSHAAPGCERPGWHRAFFVVPEASPARTLADLRGARFAINSDDSNTGMNLPRHEAAPLAQGGRFFAAVVETGSHRASLAALQAGAADATSLDCVTHALLARHRPAALAGTRILAATAPSPTLPWVTAATTDAVTLEALRQALAATVADKSLRWAFDALLIDSVVATSAADYEILLDYARTAARLGYPELA
jgi:ABC-type phosphate/phosphonate transport system substrate-binding protein